MLDEETIIRTLDEGSADERSALLDRMGEEGFPQTVGVIKAIFRAVRREGDSIPEGNETADAFNAIPDLMASINDRSLTGLFNDSVGDQSPRIRFLSSMALAKIGDGSSVLPLLGTLFDDYCWTVSYASEALGKIGDRRAVYALMEVVRWSEENSEWDSWDDALDSAICALGKIGDERALAVLLRFSGEELPTVHIEALGRIGHPSAIPALAGDLRREYGLGNRSRVERVASLERAIENCSRQEDAGIMLEPKIKPPVKAEENEKRRIKR